MDELKIVNIDEQSDGSSLVTLSLSDESLRKLVEIGFNQVLLSVANEADQEQLQALLRKHLALRPDIERAAMFGDAVHDLSFGRIEVVVIGSISCTEAAGLAMEMMKELRDQREIVLLPFTAENWNRLLAAGNRFAMDVESGITNGESVLLKGNV